MHIQFGDRFVIRRTQNSIVEIHRLIMDGKIFASALKRICGIWIQGNFHKAHWQRGEVTEVASAEDSETWNGSLSSGPGKLREGERRSLGLGF